ncbi:MAG: M3 family metallopeptidase, partial [Thermoanaerobaculia bacterium]|nr:M3 family metallopeptidase [Thermoanaerobaculia bacterium]
MSRLKSKSSDTHSADRTTLPVHDPVTLDHSCRRVLEIARAKLQTIAAIPLSEASVENVFEPWDDVEIVIEDVFGPVSLLDEVHPVSSVRAVADERLVDLATFTTEIYQDVELYERIRAVEPSKPRDRMLKKDLLEAFEDNGIALDEGARERFRQISQRVTELSQRFAKNIREKSTKVRFSREEIEGLPDEIADALERDGDDVLVSLDHTDYNPFMMSVHDESARMRLLVAHQRRGGEDNLRILDEIVDLRSQIADLYGLETYAHYVTRRQMIETPSNVHRFLDEVLEAVSEREQKDLETLVQAKARASNRDPSETEIHRWDLQYWSERVREERYAIDQEALRSYFPTEASVEWVLMISEQIYGLRFERIDVPVWHRDVLYFDAIDDVSGELLGGIYLDLYPRDGKYKHAAAWPVRGASQRTGRKPVSVLVTNFDRRGLTHRDLETLLHEFGHVLHGVLSATWYNLHSGTSVQRDFVEAPSQMFEEWGRRLESLQLIREICSECPEIDGDLTIRLEAARQFGKGVHYARQHLYASYDMALAGIGVGNVLDHWRHMEEQTPLGYVADTMFPAAFGHITSGYAAGYYGYLWSETIASDLLSAFDKNLMDPETGRKFRDEV